uniref:hypothetical protein n=1 Tax=Paractinoplanes polyasparticus TaxID=2856853 RepID=UPI001C8490A8|nr:hypothetical protein [Actinoplanes polyasparticus]
MSYPVQPPPIAATPPVSPSGRPPAVTFAAALLWLMAGVGLIYAIATVAIVPGTIDRFRDVTAAPVSGSFTGDNDPEYYVAVVWLGAAIALALAVIAFALFVVVGLSLRRGSNAARIAALVVSVLGILGGTAGVLTLAAQRSGNSAPWSLGAQLSDAYPDGWIGTNAGLAIAQILGYALVGILILTAPRTFFRRPAAPSAPQPVYGAAYPGHGVPANAAYPSSAYPGPGYPPSASQPAAGYPASGAQSAGYPPFGGHPAGVPAPGSQPAAGYPASGAQLAGYPPLGGQPAGAPAPGGQLAGYPAPGGQPTGYPLPGTQSAGYADGAYPPAHGYGPESHPAQAPNPGSTRPDHSPYARPADHAPDAAFTPQAPTQPASASHPPADPRSPYARPTRPTAAQSTQPASTQPASTQPASTQHAPSEQERASTQQPAQASSASGETPVADQQPMTEQSSSSAPAHQPSSDQHPTSDQS